MTISIQAARRKEYPEMAEDVRQEKDKDSGKFKEVRVRVPISDIFYLMFRDPIDNLFKRIAISYDKKKTRLMPEDIRNFEAETNAQPILVQKELYYVHNPETGMWVDIKGAKNHFSHYHVCTDEYWDSWRPQAYPKDSQFEDPFKGHQRPPEPNPMEIRLHMRERQLSLMEAKERGMTIPMLVNNTGELTGHGGHVSKGEPGIEKMGRGAFQAGPSGQGQQVRYDILGFIPPVKN